MPSSLTVLVTGAAGFIGSHTTDQLLKAGHPVVGVDNFRTGKPGNLDEARRSPNFRFAEADVSSPGVVFDLLKEHRVQAVIHLAALVSVPESVAAPELNFRLNVDATQQAAEAARRAGVQRLVFASSAAVYRSGDILPGAPATAAPAQPALGPASPYGAAKLASEFLLLSYAASYGITVRCQRYFNVYGPRQDPKSPYSGVISIFSDRLLAHQAPTIFGDGEQSRDFISVRDVARANVLAATAKGLSSGVADICTGSSVSLNRLYALMAEGRSALPPTYGPARKGDIRHSLGDPQAARTALNFSAKIDLATGLAELR